jgi:hypothetical protein
MIEQYLEGTGDLLSSFDLPKQFKGYCPRTLHEYQDVLDSMMKVQNTHKETLEFFEVVWPTLTYEMT